MGATCPRCGPADVAGDWCPRCGVDVARYRAELAARTETPAPAAAGAPAARWPAPSPRPPVAAVVAPPPRPAGFWIRAVAYGIDALVLYGGSALLSMIAEAVFRDRAAGRAVQAALTLAVVAGGTLYWIVPHWLYGQTLGKAAVGVRVVDAASGGPITLLAALLRLLGYWLSWLTFGIGYLLAAFRTDKRALHDLVAGTRVERTS
jgi:uncharacterized RDD family membrane protein YckC